MPKFAEAGYDCVIFPVSTLRVAMKAVHDLLAEIKEHGTVEGKLGQMYTRQELYRTLQYTPGKEWTFPSPTLKDTATLKDKNPEEELKKAFKKFDTNGDGLITEAELRQVIAVSDRQLTRKATETATKLIRSTPGLSQQGKSSEARIATSVIKALLPSIAHQGQNSEARIATSVVEALLKSWTKEELLAILERQRGISPTDADMRTAAATPAARAVLEE